MLTADLFRVARGELGELADGVEYDNLLAGLGIVVAPMLGPVLGGWLTDTPRYASALKVRLRLAAPVERSRRPEASDWAPFSASDSDSVPAIKKLLVKHRLAVAAFRQQLLEWQGQVGEMKQALLQNDVQLTFDTPTLSITRLMMPSVSSSSRSVSR